MSDHTLHARNGRRQDRGQQGYSLVEMVVALAIILIVMGSVVSGVMQFSRTQSMVWNRSDMHGAVRSATELLQQEVGQAGRVSFPANVTMSSAIAAPGPATVTVTSTSNMFVGEQVVVDAGPNEETVTVTAVPSTTTFTANFGLTHAANVPVSVRGGFASGVVPCASTAACPGSSGVGTFTNGSTGTTLKLFGDINGDGTMVYVEYVCDIAAGTLTRNMMAYNAAAKPAVTPGQVLLTNVIANPANGAGVVTPCFTYEQKTVTGRWFVVNVAITLTTQSQNRDPITQEFQTETKALLNVAPRNVFQAWMLASASANQRVQATPPSVTCLLATGATGC